MLLFMEEKLAFLCVPKTGTTAFERALGRRASLRFSSPPGLKHLSLRKFNSEIQNLIEDENEAHFETVAVIREPIDWLGSWYRYRRRDSISRKENSTRDISFDAFCRAYMATDRPPYARINSQATFLDPGPEGAEISHLYRYEEQEALVDFFEARLKFRPRLPRVNVSPRMDLEIGEDTRAALREFCARDYALWQQAQRCQAI